MLEIDRVIKEQLEDEIKIKIEIRRNEGRKTNFGYYSHPLEERYISSFEVDVEGEDTLFCNTEFLEKVIGVSVRKNKRM